MVRGRRFERRHRLKRIVEPIRKAISNLFNHIRGRTNDYVRNYVKRQDAERERLRKLRRIQRVTKIVQEIKARKLTAYAMSNVPIRLKTAIDLIWNEYYRGYLYDLMNQLTELSKAGISYVPSDLPNAELLNAFARYYYAPCVETGFHMTANMIRLTPLTYQYLKENEGDYYIVSEVSTEDLLPNMLGEENPMYWLFRFLEKILEKKPRKHRFRKKRKGHYGKIDLNEPIHVVMNSNLEEILTTPLRQILYSDYDLRRYEAWTIGKPEKAFRIGDVNVGVIIGRRSYTTRHRTDKMTVTQLYKREKRFRLYKR